MKYLPTIFLLFFLGNLGAQNLITLIHQGQSTFFEERELGAAVNAAQHGDTILCPGGEFILSLSIDKRIHILGVGHRPDSTYATGMSRLVGNVSFAEMAQTVLLFKDFMSRVLSIWGTGDIVG